MHNCFYVVFLKVLKILCLLRCLEENIYVTFGCFLLIRNMQIYVSQSAISSTLSQTVTSKMHAFLYITTE